MLAEVSESLPQQAKKNRGLYKIIKKTTSMFQEVGKGCYGLLDSNKYGVLMIEFLYYNLHKILSDIVFTFLRLIFEMFYNKCCKHTYGLRQSTYNRNY